MSHSIGLSPDKKKMTFGISKFNPDAGKDKHFADETKIEMSKKDARQLIRDLRNWAKIMVE